MAQAGWLRSSSLLKSKVGLSPVSQRGHRASFSLCGFAVAGVHPYLEQHYSLG